MNERKLKWVIISFVQVLFDIIMFVEILMINIWVFFQSYMFENLGA